MTNTNVHCVQTRREGLSKWNYLLRECPTDRHFAATCTSNAGRIAPAGSAKQTCTAASKPLPSHAQLILRRVEIMLYTIAVVMLVLWLLGLITSYTMGGFIHALLVIAIVVVLLRVIRG